VEHEGGGDEGIGSDSWRQRGQAVETPNVDSGDNLFLLRLKHSVNGIFLCCKFMGEAFVPQSRDFMAVILEEYVWPRVT